MKAIVIDDYGGPDVLVLKEVPVPEITDEQVLLRVKAAGVNPADWKIREGWLAPFFPHQLPLIPGWDVAGIVESVGKNVTLFRPGDEVYAYNRLAVVQYGSYAEFAPVDECMLAAKPVHLDFAEAASVPLTALTAWQSLLDFGHLKADESVLVTAGAGGVGGFAIQIAKHLGARVCAAASAHNHDYLKALGVDHVIDYHHDDIEASVKEFSAEGVDLVLDCTGREDVAINFKYVRRRRGRVASINGLLHTVPELEKNAARCEVEARLVVAEPNGAQLAEISRWIENNDIRPLPVEVLPLEQAREAQIKSQHGHVRGKLALIID